MAAGTYTIHADQGATLPLHFTWLEPGGGDPIDLTGYTVRMQVRRTALHPQPVLVISPYLTLGGEAGTITGAVPAEVMASLPAGEYRYDLEVESGGGEVRRLLKGAFIVDPEVSR